MLLHDVIGILNIFENAISIWTTQNESILCPVSNFATAKKNWVSGFPT